MVNKQRRVNLDRRAFRILREVPGLTVVPDRKSPTTADAVVEFAGARTRVFVEFKSAVNAATAWQLVQRKKGHPGVPWLLVSLETTADARRTLKEHGIGVVDALGHAHIELPGLLFHLEGHAQPRRVGRARLRGKAGVVAQALLLEPQNAWKVNRLAEQAGVAASLAHRVLTRLEREGIVAVEGAGPDRTRRIVNKTALLDLWAEEESEEPLRTFAYRFAQTPQQLIRELGTSLDHGYNQYAFTGAAAASLLSPFATSIAVVELWIDAVADVGVTCRTISAEQVADGHNVVLLQGRDDGPLRFRRRISDLWLADPFRIYADLRRDPRRGLEQAEHLRREVIGF